MNKTELKKALYKQKPEARFSHIRKGNAYYYADLEECRVHFEIPVSDMGDADFNAKMDGKLLNRWIVEI
jgi:hypothetical protein